jgi:hypothetical protein
VTVPHWLLICLLVAVGWLTAAVGGGLLLGRLLAHAAQYTSVVHRRRS